MKILYVRGNPRDNGVTEIVGNLFLRGLKKGGADILDFRLSEKNIGDCRGCFACSGRRVPRGGRPRLPLACIFLLYERSDEAFF